MNPSEQGYVSWSRIRGLAEDVVERLAVGVELDAAVDDDLQVGQTSAIVDLPRQVEEPLEQGEEPARHARRPA